MPCRRGSPLVAPLRAESTLRGPQVPNPICQPPAARHRALLLCIVEHPPPQRALNIHGWQCDSFSSLAHADPHIRVRVASESTTCLLDGFVSLPRFPCSTQRVTPSELGLGGTGQSPYTTLIGPMVERLAVVPPAASALANGTRRQPSSEPRPPLVTTPLSCSPHRDTAATDMDRHAVGAAHRRALAGRSGPSSRRQSRRWSRRRSQIRARPPLLPPTPPMLLDADRLSADG